MAQKKYQTEQQDLELAKKIQADSIKKKET